VPLFDRIGRRVQLTSEGEDMLARGRRLLADADSIGERARALKGGHVGILRIGTTPQMKSSREKVPSWRADLSNTVTCGSMPCL
jgi:DNA-binding transcriptional LysR family regulator